MKSFHLSQCLVVVVCLTATLPLAAQNRNWIPARQFQAVDRWQRENRVKPKEESAKPANEPVASSSKNGKTKTSPVSSDGIRENASGSGKSIEENGPILLPPSPAQSGLPQGTSEKFKESSPSKVVPAEIPEVTKLESEFGQVELPAIDLNKIRMPEGSDQRKQTLNNRGIQKKAPSIPPNQETSVKGKREEANSEPLPGAQRSKSPVTILRPIPETGDSPIRAQTNYRNQPDPKTQQRFNRSPTDSVNQIPQSTNSLPTSLSTTVSELEGDHWIVSARRCDETQLSNSCRDCLEFFYGNGQTALQRVTWDEFFGTLQPSCPVSFFIHGSFINWPGAVTEAQATSRWIRSAAPGVPVRVVYFTWPSDVNIAYLLPIDVHILGQRSNNFGFHLAHLVGQLNRSQPVTLVGHSHGARLASATMHLLAGGSIDGERLSEELTGDRKIRMVLAAAALDRHWLNPGELYGRALSLPEGVLNLKNSADYALNVYPLTKPFGVESFGLSGPKTNDRMQLGEYNKKLTDVEIAPLLGAAHTWPSYYHEPQLARVMAPYVFHQPLLARKGDQGVSRSRTVRAMPMPDQQTQAPSSRSISVVKTPKAVPVEVTPVGTRSPSR